MSLLGRYEAENNDDFLSHYYIVMDVKETDKSYIVTLVELDSGYSASHMQLLFSKSKRAVIRKDRSGHAIRVWSDDDFTLYPFQAGIPFYFVKQRGGTPPTR